jgi:hypothetical protein
MSEFCRTCKAPIRWALTADGNAIPLDPEPSSRGNLRFRADGEHVVIVPEEARATFVGSLYLSHFATCPFADLHRRRRAV